MRLTHDVKASYNHPKMETHLSGYCQAFSERIFSFLLITFENDDLDLSIFPKLQESACFSLKQYLFLILRLSLVTKTKLTRLKNENSLFLKYPFVTYWFPKERNGNLVFDY